MKGLTVSYDIISLHCNWATSYSGRTRRSCVEIHPYMASCYWFNTQASCWLVNWKCACDAGTFIGCYCGSYTWLGPDQYMYVKEKLTQCNRFGMSHAVTAYTRKQVEDISSSYPTFIDVLQPVTSRIFYSTDVLVGWMGKAVRILIHRWLVICAI